MSDSLLDIAPVTEIVSVAGKQIEVSGISMRDIATLLVRFPQLMQLFGRGDKEFTATGLAVSVPEAIGAIIAAGVGAVNNKKMEMAIEKLPLGDQVALLSSIIKLSLPGGLGPLVEQVESLTAMVGKVPAVSIQNEQSNGSSRVQSSI